MDVGVDLEKIDQKINRIKRKFLSPEELENLSAENNLEQLFICWCAKESMYKWHGKKQLDFREHLFISPFTYSASGKLNGRISKNEFQKELVINFEKVDDYMMAYTASL